MGSILLKIASRYICPLLVGISVLLFFSGHTHPGGGFIAGLTASVAFIVYAFAYDQKSALAKLRFSPRVWMLTGLSLAVAAALAGPFSGKPFMTARWISFRVAGLGAQHWGTPLLFDLGIYILVIGAVATIISNLAEES